MTSNWPKVSILNPYISYFKYITGWFQAFNRALLASINSYYFGKSWYLSLGSSSLIKFYGLSPVSTKYLQKSMPSIYIIKIIDFIYYSIFS